MGRLTRISPSWTLETRALIAASLSEKPIGWIGQVATIQALESVSYGFLDEAGHLAAALMFWPQEAGVEEMAMACAWRPRPERYLPSAVALTRLSMAERFDTGVSVIRAQVLVRNPSGHRLARLAGFAPASETEAIMLYEARP